MIEALKHITIVAQWIERFPLNWHALQGGRRRGRPRRRCGFDSRRWNNI